MTQTAVIPLEEISRLEIVVTDCRQSLDQVKAETGADYLLNGGMWNTNGTPCKGLKVDGKLLSATPWGDIAGYGWNTPGDIRLKAKWDDVDNYIATSPLILDGKPLDKIPYDSAQGGRRPRSAMGIVGNSLLLFCSSDAMTPEEVRDELVDRGCSSAMMLDSGGSSQCYFDGEIIRTDRLVHNWIAVWTKSNEEKEDTVGTYRVTPSIGVNVRSGPGTSYEKVTAYAQNALVTVLETQDGWGRTDKGWVSMAYLEAVQGHRTTDNGIVIQEDFIPAGRKNRPGKSNPDEYITIHETGNFSRGADAAAHASYVKSDSAANDYVSWHYTVDDHTIVQHIPDGETAYHAGDGKDGPGNNTTIGIEICVNPDGDFEKAKENAASLVRLLMSEYDIDIAHVVQHNHWSGKDCPYTIRHTNTWDAFLDLCGGEKMPASELEAAVETLGTAGILTAVDYWKGNVYSTSNVHALLKSMAAYVRRK